MKEGKVMQTKVALIKDIEKDSKYLIEAAKIIKEGGIVAFPTETVYGLGANALDQEAVKKIFVAKGRPQDNPLIVHVADFNLSNIAKEIPQIAKELMETFWPGPLTIILKKQSNIPNITSANLDTIGIRMPSDLVAKKFIEISSCPIAAPSANISGRPSPTDMERCVEDLNGRVDYILGGEKSNVGVESTIVDCTVNPPCVLRPGGITLEMLREIDSNIYIDPAIMEKPSENLKPKAPGMKYRHYAPKAKVKIIDGECKKTIEKINEMVQNYIEQGKAVGIMATNQTKDYYKNEAKIISIGDRADLSTVTKNLFEALRTFDDLGVDVILCESFEEKGLGVALMNRLKKSAGFDIISV